MVLNLLKSNLTEKTLLLCLHFRKLVLQDFLKIEKNSWNKIILKVLI
nr:MAG TPA: hypothetical protein [Caudoviricetes sp.]